MSNSGAVNDEMVEQAAKIFDKIIEKVVDLDVIATAFEAVI